MTAPILLCTDGSTHANHAITAGLDLVGTSGPMVVVTVVHDPDPMLVTGTGMAGGVVSPEAFDLQVEANRTEGQEIVETTVNDLGLTGVETKVLMGDPGAQVCALANELEARAIVLGSRGRGGFRRALLGSVSDHIVRNSPCPVVITGPKADEDQD